MREYHGQLVDDPYDRPPVEAGQCAMCGELIYPGKVISINNQLLCSVECGDEYYKRGNSGIFQIKEVY